ncbi:MAG: hypothetical protein KIS87_08515 [Phycisphaeraceae bacterium]|nr:hypothetical protein [Phycisphaeraceae bacterium]
MRKSLLAGVAAATFAGAGMAHGFTIIYMMTGTLSATGGDSQGLSGATLTAVAHYDGTALYINSFGFAATPAIIGSPKVTISGSSNGANNTTTGYTSDLAFYPTFAGTFTHPAGGHTEFFTGSGALMQFTMNTSPSAGAANAFVGTVVELDDFAPANYTGSGLINLHTGEGYLFHNVTITAVPAPGAAALLGFAGLAACRRRR